MPVCHILLNPRFATGPRGRWKFEIGRLGLIRPSKIGVGCQISAKVPHADHMAAEQAGAGRNETVSRVKAELPKGEQP